MSWQKMCLRPLEDKEKVHNLSEITFLGEKMRLRPPENETNNVFITQNNQTPVNKKKCQSRKSSKLTREENV